MNELLKKYWEQIKKIWNNLERNQKIFIGSAAGIIFLSLVLLTIFASRIEYVYLFQDLKDEDAGKITKQLEDWNVKFLLEGNAVKVPVTERDRIRLRLAEENVLPKGGVIGFELFNKVKYGTTEYERKINYFRALQGELTRTIESLSQIKEARVIIPPIEKKLYLEDQEDITASVNITLKPYATLTKEQTKGIVNLVASAVPGLKKENVTLVDNQGNILSEFEDEEAEYENLTTKQLEIQRKESQKLENQVRKKLARVLGFDKVEVSVKWEMNFDRVEKKEEKYSSPGFEQLKVSDEKLRESFEGKGVKPEGPPGVEPNLPNYKAVMESEGPVKYQRSEDRTNYSLDKTFVTSSFDPEVTKIAVAVFIDGTYEIDSTGNYRFDKSGNPIYNIRTREEMRKFEDLVRAAIGEAGDDPDKKYVIKVDNIQFDRREEFIRIKAQIARKKFLEQFSIIAIFAVVFLILGIILIKEMQRRRKLREAELSRQKALERESALRALEEKSLEVQLSLEEKEKLEIKQNAEKIAKQKPALVANLIRTWLIEE